MLSPVRDRAVIDIRETVCANCDVAEDLLAIQGISSVYTVACFHGLGKVSLFKTYRNDSYSLSNIGNIAKIESIERQATAFICAAYGKLGDECKTMTECRIKI